MVPRGYEGATVDSPGRRLPRRGSAFRRSRRKVRLHATVAVARAGSKLRRSAPSQGCRTIVSRQGRQGLDIKMTRDDVKHTLVADLLQRTASAVGEADLGALRGVCTEALKAKVHHDLAKSPEFREHLAFLSEHIAGQSDEQLVLTLAELGRLRSSIRSNCEWISDLAARLLTAGAPATFQFGDGDQRYHAAVAVVTAGIPIQAGVVAKAIVEEEKGEKARRVWVEALLESVTLSEVFECITQAFAESSGISGEARSLRLQRILEALNNQFTQSDTRIDENFRNGFRNFVAKAFFHVPPPREYGASAAAVEELVKASIHLIRLKFRLGADPEFYRAVALAERWLPDGGWMRLTGTSAGLRQLRRNLVEGLFLLLELGRPDDALLEAHRRLSPSRKFAQEELCGAEKSAHNLSPDLRRWLASGGTKKLAARTVELNETDDLSIAMAMIVADSLRHRADAGIDTMLDDIRFKAPIHFDTITGVVDLTRQLIDRVTFLADRRRLRLFGSPGEVVDFSPHAYRLPDNNPLTRRVQVQSPGVEKQGRSASRVIVPALVEAVD